MKRILPVLLWMLATAYPALAVEKLPEDTLLFGSDHNGRNFEIYRMALHDRELVALTGDPAYDASWPRLSPDRRHILFQRAPKSGKGGADYKRMSLWVMDADGKNQRQLRPEGTDSFSMQGHTEWSPDGQKMALFGGKGLSTQIYLTDTDGRLQQQLTDRGGQNLDPSWSPDGKYIAFVSCPIFICFESNYEIYLMQADGAEEPVRLTDDDLCDHDPYFSPDGKYLAWLTQTSDKNGVGSWGIRIMETSGKQTIRTVIDDGNINSYPAWSPDGRWIYFHRLVFGDNRFHIYRIRPDGSGLEGVTTHLPGTQEYPDL